MNWTELLHTEIRAAYDAAEGLVSKVNDDALQWKPDTGENWMTLAQLLMHITDACGYCCRGFVTGEWGMPADTPMEEMLPAAERMPSVETAAQALELLRSDRKLALEMVEQAGEEDLGSRLVSAPWSPDVEEPLGRKFLQMVGHLTSHKAQLFYYLKLMGEPVHTGDLWGG